MDTKDIKAIRERLRRTMEYEEWRCSGRQVERDQRTLDREALLQHIDELREALMKAERVAAGEREAREKCEWALCEKDKAMGQLMEIVTPEQLKRAGIYIP